MEPSTGNANQTRDDEASLGPWSAVAPGVHVAVAEPDRVNIGLVVGTERCLVVDTGSSPAQGRAIREAVARVTDIPLAGALVTHGHRDHWFGLAAFADLETWGHESLEGRRCADHLLADLIRLGVDRDDVVAPSTMFSLAAAIDLGGGVRVEALHLGEAHTDGDVLALVPGANVLFAGDLVEFAGDPEAPWFSAESSPRGWAGVLNLTMGMVTAETVVVPGHGRVAGRDDLVAQMGALASIPYEAEHLVQEGVSFDDAEERGEWALPWPNIAEGVRTAYREMNALGVRTRLPIVKGDLGD
ncbi:hypothetical protein GCM10027418_19770 [Mariniluteicoccus endophyticus]